MAAVLLMTAGCGYHTSGHAVRLPSDLHTLYVPGFGNTTQTYGINQTITEDVVRELHSRTNYRIVTVNNDDTADATLTGAVTYSAIAPLTYDSHTGRVSSAMVMIGIKASLVNRKGKVLWENPNYLYREQYQVSRDVGSFFEEEEPALKRVANDFARTLVSDILEAY
jgi:outer membrane lipopolysaccharide assembly protein LptE/RlpB